MCGIAGSWCPGGDGDAESLHACGRVMAAALAHRGPDGEGVHVDAGNGLLLAHRRLAILDRSEAGRQPMASPCGRWIVVFNGELYNHGELRRLLGALGYTFRGRSGTEALVAAIAQWGFDATLQRTNGMFALAAWDASGRRLWLARDRFGEKPLYVTRDAAGRLLFGSELAALRAHPRFNAAVDQDALAQLLRFGYVPALQAILRGVRKLPAGHLLVLDRSTLRAGLPASRPWWSAVEQQDAAIRDRFTGDLEQAVDPLDVLLRDAVDPRREADVPLGVLLSGGIDSSLVATLLQARSAVPVRSLVVGFAGVGADESARAEVVARHLGMRHETIRLDAARAAELVPALARTSDERLADPSLVPTSLLCREVRRSLTVALSGDGGDELFFGYERYARALRNRRWLARLPAPLRRLLAGDPGEAARLGGVAALRAACSAESLQATLAERFCRGRAPPDVGLRRSHCVAGIRR